MNNKKIGWIVCIALVLGIFGLSGLWLTHAKYHQQLISERTGLTSDTKSIRNVQEIHHEKVQNKANREGIKSKNPYVATVATHNYSYELANTLSRKFFEVFLTWDNGDSYRQRGSLLTNIASSQLLKNKKVFDDGKGVTGDDYIENSGLQAEYENSSVSLLENRGNNIECLVKANYEAWTDDTAKNKAVRYYDIKIDKNKGLVTELKSLGNMVID